MRLGILGGTFDPPHLGHLVLAQEAADQLELERVLFMPAAHPPHKELRDCAPIEHRLVMVELAIAGNASFAVSRLDAERTGPNYTVDLLARVKAQQPEAELYFLMGLDSLAELPRWSRPRELIELSKLAVMGRPGFAVGWRELERAIPGLRERVVELHTPRLEIASSDLQARARHGRPLRYLAPDAVIDYIHTHQLYL